MEQTCLNCRWLEELGELHRWHQCVWPAPAHVPCSVQVVRAAVNVAAPFRECPVWEAAAHSVGSGA